MYCDTSWLIHANFWVFRAILSSKVGQTDLVFGMWSGFISRSEHADYKYLCAAVKICSALVNIQTAYMKSSTIWAKNPNLVTLKTYILVVVTAVYNNLTTKPSIMCWYHVQSRDVTKPRKIHIRRMHFIKQISLNPNLIIR